MKNFFKFIKNKCKGFSLIELVVVIAIMAVLAAVLTPALIHYIEDSRAVKDDHAMQEVVNAVKTSMAYDDVYDEVVSDINWKKSCYVHSPSISDDYKKVLFEDDENKTYQSYMYTNEARTLDEVAYTFAGRMYGATLTFKPNTNNEIELKNAIYVGSKSAGKKINAMSDDNNLYSRVRQIVGNKIELSSATYKHSSFTIFICFGVDGKKTASQDKVTLSDEPPIIYGEWNGTNLSEVADTGEIADVDTSIDTTKHDNVVADGATYTTGRGSSKTDYGAGEGFPTDPKPLDVYKYGDYTYVYSAYYAAEPYTAPIDNQFAASSYDGWLVTIRQETSDDTLYPYMLKKSEYGTILSEIAGKPVMDMSYTFYNCNNMKKTPEFPNEITQMSYTFVGCSALADVATIPNGVTQMVATFENCSSLKSIPNIPDNVVNLDYAFNRCSLLSNVPAIPSSAESINFTFDSCSSLVAPPIINGNIKYMQQTFNRCTNLTGVFDLKGIPIQLANSAFYNTSKPIYVICDNPTKFKNCSSNVKFYSSSPKEYESFISTQKPYQPNINNENIYSWNYDSNKTVESVDVVVVYQMDDNADYVVLTDSTGAQISERLSSPNKTTKIFTNFAKSGRVVLKSDNNVNEDCEILSIYVFPTAKKTVIKTNPNSTNYANSIRFKNIGTWNYSDAKSVNITISGITENATWDYIFITDDFAYSSGDITTVKNRRLVTNTGSVNTVSSNVSALPSQYRIGGSVSKRFTNVPITKGSVIFKTDSSVVKSGLTITITPNY